MYPDEHDYDEVFPTFLAAFDGEAFAHDTVWQLDDFAAVALVVGTAGLIRTLMRSFGC